MREKFSVPELTALKSELLQGFDSKDATELVQMFLAGHGYGVSAEEARNAVARVGSGWMYSGSVPKRAGEHCARDVENCIAAPRDE